VIVPGDELSTKAVMNAIDPPVDERPRQPDLDHPCEVIRSTFDAREAGARRPGCRSANRTTVILPMAVDGRASPPGSTGPPRAAVTNDSNCRHLASRPPDAPHARSTPPWVHEREATAVRASRSVSRQRDTDIERHISAPFGRPHERL